MPLRAVLLSGVRLGDSGAASGAMQACQQLGAGLGVAILVCVFTAAVGGAITTVPGAFSAALADASIAGTALAVLTLALVVFAVRPPRL